MNRRSFVKTSVVGSAVAGLAALGQTQVLGQSSTGQHYLEWRRFIVKSKEKRAFVTAFMQDAAIPALNRIGVKPVGVFYAMDDLEDHSVSVLTSYRSIQEYASAAMRLGEDPTFMEAATGFFSTPKSDPAYERMENSLMLAFAAYPTVKVPRRNPERIFELRTYESHNEMRGYLKVEMFNTAELEIFAKTGLDSVFCGQAMVASNLPQLTYMLAFKDKQEREANWKKFVEHPDWNTLKNEVRYKDTVSKIHQTFLVPAPGSQI